MSSVTSILADFATLSRAEKNTLIKCLASMVSVSAGDLGKYVADERFSGGVACPHCGGRHVVRQGHRNDGTQRYLCRECGKTFVPTSKTIVSGSRYGLSVWEKYVGCMIDGLSVRKAATVCGIHRNTAFAWRHKILGALQKMADSVKLDGIVEADETFFPVSYKGNHRKGSFVMPRRAHKRGKSVRVRGLSREQVCVPCAVNRNGLSLAKASNVGRVATRNLHAVYDSRFSSDCVLVTDKMNAYTRFANKNGISLIQLKGGKAQKGIYNIQHINNYHSQLKRFMYGFNGVSTKHLNNYLTWHNFVNYAKGSAIDKKAILLRFSLTQNMVLHVKDIAKKPALPFAV
ncbi:MAG: IS1595 family transposase [Lachnospiraceae bacterium]|nr:IS1595 family transposase [Lachnospiraceae bacterium]